MIGDTAAISLLTGLPGAGKTLRLVQRIVDLLEASEHVYACNINGLAVPGVTPWDDPRKWQELPAGAILFVDEAQEFFPARRTGEPAQYIRELSKLRHTGVRIVLVTQQAEFIDSYVRSLVGFHEHLYRTHGKSESFIFRNNQLMEQVKLPFKRIKGLYDYEKWDLPKKYFAYYKSAELHTIAYRMPAVLRRAMLIIPLTVAAFASALIGYVYFVAPDQKEAVADGAPAAGPAHGGGGSSPTSSTQVAPENADTYVEQFIPRIPSQPWSAPFYDSLAKASVPPTVYCMIGGDHKAGTCTCLTDQGTKYWLDSAECRLVALDGQYQPYLDGRENRSPSESHSSGSAVSESPARQPQHAGSAVPAAVSPGGQSFGTLAAYGDITVAPPGTNSSSIE